MVRNRKGKGQSKGISLGLFGTDIDIPPCHEAFKRYYTTTRKLRGGHILTDGDFKFILLNEIEKSNDEAPEFVIDFENDPLYKIFAGK